MGGVLSTSWLTKQQADTTHVMESMDLDVQEVINAAHADSKISLGTCRSKMGG